jgi:hypothetical protein
MPTHATSADVSEQVQHWVEAGIISDEQATAIRADLTASGHTGTAISDHVGTAASDHVDTQPALSVGSLLAEALGYLGGAIMIVALGLAAGKFWPDLPTPARLALAVTTAFLLLVAGMVVPASHTPAAGRLRSVLWVLSSGCGAGFLALLGSQSFHWQDDHVALFAAAGTAVYTGLLWWRHHQVLQHAAVVVSLIVTVGVATSLLPQAETSPAASVWALGVVWSLLGWGGILAPRRETLLLGALVACAATTVFSAQDWGTPLALATLAGLAFLAIRLRDLALLAITAVTTLMALPPMVTHYFPGLLSAAMVLLVVGAILVAAAVFTVRRRTDHTPFVSPQWSTGTPRVAVPLAALVAGVTAACIVVALA